MQTEMTTILTKFKEIIEDLDQRITKLEEKSLNTSNSARYDIGVLHGLIEEFEQEMVEAKRIEDDL